MLPEFRKPVQWRVDGLPHCDQVLPLLMLEAAEFEAVFGKPVSFGTDGRAATDCWEVVVDQAADHATLASDLVGRRLLLTIPDPAAFIDGVNLLHSLAYSGETSVSDTEAPSYAAAFDRIRDEVSHIYPSMELRGLDWEAITEEYGYVRDLDGPDFWDHAARWVAELGDAHTQLISDQQRFHPPYVAAMDDHGATLRLVPDDSDAWAAGVRPGDRLVVEEPQLWLRTVGASPQHRSMIAARRFLTMSTDARSFTAISRDQREITWTETRRQRPSLVADGNRISISSINGDLPEMLSEALQRANPNQPLTVDLRGNTGGDLVAAADARRLFVRDDVPFGAVAFTTGRGTLAPPRPLTATPHPDGWPGELRVLIDSMTYSAAEDFLHPLVGASHVTVIGSPTGGGSGRPHTRLIKDSVRLATSTAITYTRDGAPIEYRGIQPTHRRSGGASASVR